MPWCAQSKSFAEHNWQVAQDACRYRVFNGQPFPWLGTRRRPDAAARLPAHSFSNPSELMK